MGLRWIGSAALALGLAVVCGAYAADAPAAGRWQGLLKVGPQDLKVVVRLEEREPSRFGCFVNVVQRGADALRCTSATVEGNKVRFAVAEQQLKFEGTLSWDGQALEGTWTSTTGARPLRLAKAGAAEAWPTDPAPHKEILVTASDGTRLEVLDFGGTGSPVVLISGFGETAHAFDRFAPKLAGKHRVYAVTRRAVGLSDQPPLDPANYNIRRLAKDVVDVMDHLKLDRAALAGWSFGGAELSAMAHHHPGRVSALIYLDAGYAYAFYAPGNAIPGASNLEIGLADLRDKLNSARLAPSKEEAARLYEEVTRVSLPQLQTDIAAAAERQAQLSSLGLGPSGPGWRLMMRQNLEKFGPVKGIPILNLYALPSPPTDATAEQAADEALGLKWRREQIARYRAAHPGARVVEVGGAGHDIFDTHPEVVLREIEGLLGRP